MAVDERKMIFIDTVEALFALSPLSVPDEARDFFEDYKKAKTSNKKVMTDKGLAILNQMKEVDEWITAKSLGELMDLSGRSVSGTMRKLVEDGYVNKMEGSPASYKISEKGMNFKIEDTIEEN